MSFVQKLQNQPQGIKKLIFWLVLILFAILLSWWWWNSAKNNIARMQIENPVEGAKFPEVNLPPFPLSGEASQK